MRNLRDYLWADSPANALQLRAAWPGACAFLAGGTTLAEVQDPALEAVIDLGRLGLDRCDLGAEFLGLGACLPLQGLVELPAVRTFAGGLVSGAARGIRTEPWRRQATVAGRLLADEPSDPLRAALLALEARAVVLRHGAPAPEVLELERAMALVPRTGIRSIQGPAASGGTLVLEIQVPVPSPGWRFSLESVSLSALDSPVAVVVSGLRVRAGAVAAARLATAALPAPRRAPHAEAVLVDRPPGPTAWAAAQAALDDDIEPGDDVRASSAYRRHLARVLLARALHRAAAGGGN
jgi:carbon-monoxide dehydrogenase medium subunit